MLYIIFSYKCFIGPARISNKKVFGERFIRSALDRVTSSIIPLFTGPPQNEKSSVIAVQ
ncbi:MAG: hypothetical protein ACRQFF_08965 [Sphaerochaeta sp.]